MDDQDDRETTSSSNHFKISGSGFTASMVIYNVYVTDTCKTLGDLDPATHRIPMHLKYIVLAKKILVCYLWLSNVSLFMRVDIGYFHWVWHWSGDNSPYFTSSGDIIYLCIYVLFSIRKPQFYSVILPYPKCIGVDQNNHKNFSFRINEMMM